MQNNQSIGNQRTFADAGGQAGASLSSGYELGMFKVIRFLGAGGMGEVYEVVHTSLKTRHALKIIRPQFANLSGFRDRFLTEARVMAKLRHPHIVHCMDCGEVDGISYLAMDYIAGPRGDPMNLGQLLEERRRKGDLLAEDEAVAVGLQVCEAVA